MCCVVLVETGLFFMHLKYILVKVVKYISFQAVLIIAGYLLGAGKPYYALALLGLIIPQVFFQVKHDS